MNRTMVKFGKMELENKITVLCIMLGVWALTIGIVAIVATIGKSQGANVAGWEMVAVGTLVLIGILMLGRYISFQDFAKQYVLAVRMGRRKRDILVSHLVFEVIFVVLSLAVTFLLYQCELWIYDKLGFVKYEFSLDDFFQIRLLICITVLLSVVSMFAGALLLWKPWIPWLVWCGGCFLFSRTIPTITEQLEEKSGVFYQIINGFSKVPVIDEIVIALIISIALGIVSKKLLYSRNL